MTETTAFLSNVVFNLLNIDTQLRYSSWGVFINCIPLRNVLQQKLFTVYSRNQTEANRANAFLSKQGYF